MSQVAELGKEAFEIIFAGQLIHPLNRNICCSIKHAGKFTCNTSCGVRVASGVHGCEEAFKPHAL